MFSSKYRNYVLLLVYVLFFAHAAVWYCLGCEKIGHLGFGEPFGTLKTGVITAGCVFTLFVFLHALLFGGWFCGWLCHWGITQDFAAGIMKRLKIKPLMVRFNSKLIPYMWFGILIAQVVLYWLYNGLPTSCSVNLGATPVWTAVPRSLFMICITVLVSCFLVVFLFGERAFCRSVCVFRLWFSWFERLAPHKIRQISDCKACASDCTEACPMGIEVEKEIKILGQVKNSECIKCNLCVGACPHGVLKPLIKKTGFEKPNAVMPPRPRVFSNALKIMQLSCTIIILVCFGFTIGGNMAKSLGFVVGTLLGCLCIKHRLSLLSYLLIAALPVCFYYANDLNDITSLAKGVALLVLFLLAAKKLGFKTEAEFIKNDGRNNSYMPLAVIALVIALAFGVSETNYSVKIHKANAALAKGDKAEYVRLMQKCASRTFAPYETYFNLARANLSLSQFEDAEKNFITSLKLSYKPEAADSILSICYSLGFYSQCAHIAAWLNSEYPQSYKYLLALGRSHLMLGEYTKAEQALKKALSLSKSNADIGILLSQAMYKNNNINGAKEVLTKAFEVNPALVAPYMAEYFAETPEQAVQYYEEALKTEPKNSMLLIGLGDCLAEAQSYKKALDAYKRVEPTAEFYLEVQNKIQQVKQALQAKKNALLGISPK